MGSLIKSTFLTAGWAFALWCALMALLTFGEHYGL